MIKVFKFYITKDNQDILYAFTLNKEVKNIFKETRNMNLFKYEKEEMGDIEFNSFLAKYKLNELHEPSECEIICTYNEYSHIYDEWANKINEDIVHNVLYDPEIFDYKYFRALAILDYVNIFDNLQESTWVVDIKPNIFHLFYDNFKALLKKG